MKAVLGEVPSGGTILAHKKINKEIGEKHELKHAEEVRDASAPIIESTWPSCFF